VPILRPYQMEVVGRVQAEARAGRRRPLIVAPTGAGKTIIAARLISDIVAGGGRVLFLAHRRELIHQSAEKLYSFGVDHGVLLPDVPMRLAEPVQVASIATLHARAVRSRRIEMPAADWIFVDEAHHVLARTYRRILEQYPDGAIVGLTATPCRGDGRGLGDAFEYLVECPQVQALIDLGFLVPTRVYAPFRPDLTGVKIARGDYVERELAARMDRQPLVGDIVEHWLRLGAGRPTVVFATSVGHSVHIRDTFRASGVVAEHLDGTTPADERDELSARLVAREIDVITNCGVYLEGVDIPSIGCLVLARPTRHHGLYRQMIGRGLRPAPGKTDCLVLDHTGNTLTFGLVEEKIAWSLHPDRRAESPQQIARARGEAPELTTCPECKAVRRRGHPCPCCGWRPQPKPIAVETLPGQLGELSRNGRVAPAPDDPVRFHGELLYVAHARGYKPGWAAHKYKTRYGHWPPRVLPPPVEPSPATLRWVRSENVRYARSSQGAT
jgi:superfamily II DNA or RNA helicase